MVNKLLDSIFSRQKWELLHSTQNIHEHLRLKNRLIDSNIKIKTKIIDNRLRNVNNRVSSVGNTPSYYEIYVKDNEISRANSIINRNN